MLPFAVVRPDATTHIGDNALRGTRRYVVNLSVDLTENRVERHKDEEVDKPFAAAATT